MSPKNNLTYQDWEEWTIQTLIYSIALPVAVVVLTSLQNGIDMKAALTAGAYALLSALINLMNKYKAGFDPQLQFNDQAMINPKVS